MGLSEDEAYEPPLWVKPVLFLSVIALIGMVLLVLALGIGLVAGDDSTVKAWDFWGNTDLLGGLLLASAVLMALGIAVLLRHNDDSLALLLLGATVFEAAMLWGVVKFEDAGGPAMLLLVMLIPFLAIFGLQADEVRRWFFHSADPRD